MSPLDNSTPHAGERRAAKPRVAKGASGPIRVLIADDSGFMRMALRKMIAEDSEFEVVGEARDGAMAVEMAKRLRPDLITMDVEMPRMTGIEATAAIMEACPTPIIMISSVTQAGAATTLEAMRNGAVDFISKSSSFVQLDIVGIEAELRRKIRHWGRRKDTEGDRVSRADTGPEKTRPNTRWVPTARAGKRVGAIDLVVVGVSTGGPRMFAQLLEATGGIGCPMIVAQHMPEIFTTSFAQQLSIDTGLNVVESADGMTVERDHVVILQGGLDSVVQRVGGDFRIKLRSGTDTTIQPNANVLFKSALLAARNPLAVILTGMGDDGADACREFGRRELPVLVQDPASCVVGGMPEAAIETGAVTDVLPLDRLAWKLRTWCRADET